VVAPPPGDRSIASEVDELDRVREALGAGEPRRAIDRLVRYDRLFPQGTLREEALRLRIEAAVTAGERATARSLAQRFQALYPDSTHSERLKALVREP
jgi:outer membrane protein assembly factor BamD (BamD/ComL family)